MIFRQPLIKRITFINILLISLIISPCLLLSQKLTYAETSKEKVKTAHNFIIKKVLAGYRIKLTSQTGKNRILQTFRITPYYGTVKWTYLEKASNTFLKAELKEEEIILTGLNKGEKVNKSFGIGSTVWNQLFNMGLTKFVLSDETKMKFYCIGTKGAGELKCGKFTAVKKQAQVISIMNDDEVDSLHVKMSLSGLLSIFWSAHYWYRKSDGLFLRYTNKKKLETASAKMVLVAEE